MTTTLSSPNTATLGMDGAASLTIAMFGKATIAFTSANDDVWPSFTVTNAQSKTYGPYGINMSVVITALDGSLTYQVNGGVPGFGYDADSNITSLVDGAGNDAFGTTAVASSRALTDADNGKTLECTATVTLTVPTGLMSNFGCAIIPNGTTSIASSGGALIQGATTTLTRAAATNAIFAIVPRASAANSYVVTGT